jgi:hypothetical protein
MKFVSKFHLFSWDCQFKIWTLSVTFCIAKLSPSPHLNAKGGTGEVGDVMQALQVDGAFAVDRVHVYHHGGFELGPVA